MHPVLLTLVTYLPLIGALIIFFMRGSHEEIARTSRWIALWTSVVVFGLSVVMWSEFDPTNTGYQFVQQSNWFSAFGVSYHMGVDGISLFFVILSTLLTLVSVLAAWQMVVHRIRDHMVAILLLETTIAGQYANWDLGRSETDICFFAILFVYVCWFIIHDVGNFVDMESNGNY